PAKTIVVHFSLLVLPISNQHHKSTPDLWMRSILRNLPGVLWAQVTIAGMTMKRILSGFNTRCRASNNDINLELDKLRGSSGKSIKLSIPIPVLDDDVFPLHVSEIVQALPKCFDSGRHSGIGNGD